MENEPEDKGEVVAKKEPIGDWPQIIALLMFVGFVYLTWPIWRAIYLMVMGVLVLLFGLGGGFAG